MLRYVRPAVAMVGLMTVLTGLVYPLAVLGLGRTLFPAQAEGSLVRRGGVVVGSELIAQGFAGAGYFHPRPSATATPYDAAASGGSNLGPRSRALVERVRGDVARLRAANPGGGAVPADMVTTSGSGLDPDISPAAALYQVKRVAAARHVPETALRDLVGSMTEAPLLGVLGRPRVNVLALNLALDRLAEAR